MAEDEMQKIKDDREQKGREKIEKHDAFVLKMKEHKKEMGLHIRNVGNVRKSLSQLGPKDGKKKSASNNGDDAYAFSTAAKRKKNSMMSPGGGSAHHNNR